MKKVLLEFEPTDLERVNVDPATVTEEQMETIADKVSDLILVNYDSYLLAACMELGMDGVS